MILTRRMRIALRVATGAVLVFIYVPIGLIVLYSFNSSRVAAWPIQGLTLGDYITPQLVSNTQFIGNVVYNEVGVAGNQPLAAAYAMVPVTIMLIYLLVARRLGAFESL